MHRLSLFCGSLLLVAAASGQEPARLIADLGDLERGEAAEIALVRIGADACGALIDTIEKFEDADEREVARLRAVFRVVDMMGADAAEVSSALAVFADNVPDELIFGLITARASLVPYASDTTWGKVFHRHVSTLKGDEKATLIRLMQRHPSRLGVKSGDLAELLQELRRNTIFRREVAAEKLGRGGSQEAIEPLRKMLAGRDKRPKGWDQLTHNGFVVPIDDQFRWRAAEAILRIAPNDPRSAIAWGCRALLHPHRSVRLDAVRSLTRFGPEALESMSELLTIARGDDPELAIEALKLLGMFGTEVGEHLAAIDALAKSSDASTARMARSLAGRLRAMGVAEPVALAVDIAEPSAAPTMAALLARLQKEGSDMPAAALRRLTKLGIVLAQTERMALLEQIILRSAETWSSKSMSTSSGGWRDTVLDQELFAELIIGDPTIRRLAKYLEHENAAVRCGAARRLAAQAGAVGVNESVRDALLAAMRAEHPKESKFKTKHSTRKIKTPMDGAIQAAAAAALVESQVPAEMHTLLLTKIEPHAEPGPVIAAIRVWSSVESLTALERLAKSKDKAVAAAARAAIARVGGKGR